MLKHYSNKIINNRKTVLVLGGSGFVGRAMIEKYLYEKWRVVIATRISNIVQVGNKIISHDFNISKLNKCISDDQLLFITKADLSETKWKDIQIWQKSFKKIGISLDSVSRVINLISDTSGSSEDILKSNLDTLDSILTVVKELKTYNKNFLFCNMGSTAEKQSGKILPPYEKTKKLVRQKLEKVGLCNYQFIVAYIKGRGEKKMTQAAKYLWQKMRISHRWLYGFKVSIIDVDDLAEIIYYILEEFTVPSNIKINKLPIEVNATNGELVFGEMVKNLLPKKMQIVPKSMIPKSLEKYFLKIYSFIIPIIKPKNQIARRLAKFAKLGSMEVDKRKEKEIFKTAEEIKNLSLREDYIVLKKESILIVVDKHKPVLHVLQEKSQNELIKVVQKSVH